MTADLHNTVHVSNSEPLCLLSQLKGDAALTKGKKTSENVALASNTKLSANTFRLPPCRIRYVKNAKDLFSTELVLAGFETAFRAKWQRTELNWVSDLFCDVFSSERKIRISFLSFRSLSIQQLMSMVYEMLHETVNSSPQCAIQLFYAVRNVFETYQSVVPNVHKENLENLPQLSGIYEHFSLPFRFWSSFLHVSSFVQKQNRQDVHAVLFVLFCAAIFHNNCMYIAHHLITLGHQYKQKLPEAISEFVTFVDMVPVFRRLGTETFLRQRIKQSKLLLDYLSGAHGTQSSSLTKQTQKQRNVFVVTVYQSIIWSIAGFMSVAEDNHFFSSEKAIKQVLHQLHHLSRVWKGVLPLSVYNQSIGKQDISQENWSTVQNVSGWKLLLSKCKRSFQVLSWTQCWKISVPV